MMSLLFGSALGFFLVALFLFCWPAAYIAGQKNRSMLTWFFAGMLFGPMAVFMVGFSPALPPEDSASPMQPLAPPTQPTTQPGPQPAVKAQTPHQTQDTAPDSRSKLFCPGCGEPLPPDGAFCQGCGRKAR